MEFVNLLVENVERAEERFLSVLTNLSVEEANAFPVADTVPSIKSVTWLTWHTAKTEPVWFSKGWKKKFALDLPDDTEDWHHTPQEAHKVVVTDIELLKDYLSDAVAATIAYLLEVNEDSLDDVVDENWTPAIKRGNRLVSIIDDAAMHSGQAIYARRLLGRED